MAKKTVKPAAAPKKTAATKKSEPAVSHDVYFSLKDGSSRAKKKCVAAGKKYLTDHSGVVWFAIGSRVEEMKREANDRDFDVALHLVFKNKAALDQYIVSERHQTFLKENRETWNKVRVFDSFADE